MMITVCVMLILIGAGSFLTIVASYLANGFIEPSFEWYSILNIFWTYAVFNQLPPESFVLLAILSAIIFALNLVSLTRDITLVRIQAPIRVQVEQNSTTAIEPQINPLAEDA